MPLSFSPHLTLPEQLEKALGMGSSHGQNIIAIGPHGGKIIGYKAGHVAIYADSNEASKLLGKKLAAAALKEEEHDHHVFEWLSELLGFAPAHTKGTFAFHKKDADLIEKAWGISGTSIGSDSKKFTTAQLFPHIGKPLTPHASEHTAIVAALASGTFGAAAPWTPEQLAGFHPDTSKELGSHGVLKVLDKKHDVVGFWKASNPVIARAEEAAARLGQLVFPKPSLLAKGEVVELKGESGCLVSVLPGPPLGSESSGHGVSSALIQKHFLRLVQHQVFDWLIGNHDAHGANFHQSPDGDVSAIDKGQAFKFITNTSLNPTSKGPGNGSNPVYVQMWSEYGSGNPTTAKIIEAVEEVLTNINKLSLEQFQQIVAPYVAQNGGSKALSDALAKRYLSMKTDWETFLEGRFGYKPTLKIGENKKEQAAPIPLTTIEAPVPEKKKPSGPKGMIPVEPATKPVAVQMPGWPLTKGKVTVHHPGAAPPPGVKWNPKYPGPGYKAVATYKGKNFKFIFDHDGKAPVITVMQEDKTQPSGFSVILSTDSFSAAGTAPQLALLGLPTTLTATEVKEKKLGYGITTLLKFDDYAEAFAGAASTATPTATMMNVKELEAAKIVSPETAKLPAVTPPLAVHVGSGLHLSADYDAVPLGTKVVAPSGTIYEKISPTLWESAHVGGGPSSYFSHKEMAQGLPTVVTDKSLPEKPPASALAPGSKLDFEDNFETMPDGSLLEDHDQTYEKQTDTDGDVWWAGENGNQYLTSEMKAKAEAQGPFTVKSVGPPKKAPEPMVPAATSSNAPEKPPKLLTSIGPEHAGIKPIVEACWAAAAKLTGSGVPGGHNQGQKSPLWAEWVPPPGLVIEGQNPHTGATIYATAAVSGYADDGKACPLVQFTAFDSLGNHATGVLDANANVALGNAVYKLSGHAGAATKNFDISGMSFPANSTFDEGHAPKASTVISQNPVDIPAAEKEKTVAKKVPFSEYIALKSTDAAYDGKFALIKTKPKYGKGGKDYYVQFSGNDSSFSPQQHVQVLAKALADAGVTGHIKIPPTPSKFKPNQAYAIVGPECLDADVNATMEVGEAAAQPPEPPAPVAWQPPTKLFALPAELADAPNGTKLSISGAGAISWVKTGSVWTAYNPFTSKLEKAQLSTSGLFYEAKSKQMTVTTAELTEHKFYSAEHAAEVSSVPIPETKKHAVGTKDELDALPVGTTIAMQNKGTPSTALHNIFTKLPTGLWQNAAKSAPIPAYDIALEGHFATDEGENYVVTKLGAPLVWNPAPTAVPETTVAKWSGPPKLYKTWSAGKIVDALKDAPVGTKVTAATGKVWEKISDQHPSLITLGGAWAITDAGSDTPFTQKGKLENLADSIKTNGGGTVTVAGAAPPAVPKPKVVAPKPQPVDPVLLKKIEDAKAYVAWKTAHPSNFSEPVLGALSQIQHKLGGEQFFAHADLTHHALLLSLDAALALGAPGEQVVTPLGVLTRVSVQALTSAFPEKAKVIGADGLTYPHGTTFKTENLPTQTKEEMVAAEAKADGWLQKVNDDHNDPAKKKVVIKAKPPGYNPNTPEGKEAGKKYLADVLAKHGIPTTGIVGGGYNVVAFIEDKAVLAEPAPTAPAVTKTTAIVPEQPKPFTAKPSPFAIGKLPQGSIAYENKADLSLIETIKPGAWGHTIRLGDPGVLRGSQMKIRRVKDADGEHYEVTGDLIGFDGHDSSLTSGMISWGIVSGGSSMQVYDEKTGVHSVGSQQTTYSGFSGETSSGTSIAVGGKAPISTRGTFIAKIKVGANYEGELKAALTLALGAQKAEQALLHHDSALERKFIKAQMVRSGLGPAGYWDASNGGKDFGNEAWLDEKLDAFKLTKHVDTAKIEVGPGGSHHVILDDIDDKLGDVKFVGTAMPEVPGQGGDVALAVENIGIGEGAPSRKQALWNGTYHKSDPATQDMTTGGGTGCAARIVTTQSGFGYNERTAMMVYHPRILKRTDFHWHNGDSFGATSKATAQGSSAWEGGGKPHQRTRMLGDSNQSYNEAWFQDGIAGKDIAGVSFNSEKSRQMALAQMKQKFPEKTHMNGIPLEAFFFTTHGHDHDEIVKKAPGLKPGVLP